MNLGQIFQYLQDLPIPTAIRTSDWMFPTVETVHVAALVFVVGTIAMVDLHLLGLVRGARPARRFADQVLPWTWSAFALALTAGSMLFSANAVQYSGNIPFRIKMALMLLAGVNMLAFHFVVHLGDRAGGDQTVVPRAAKISAGVSLCLWASIVVAGRWIGFV